VIVVRRTISVVILALLASVCGSGWRASTSASSRDATSKSTGTAGDLKRQDINPQPMSALRRRGQIVWGLDEFPSQWNFNQVDGPESSTANVLGAVLPQPMVANAEGVVHPDHDYITSIKQTSSNPQTVKAKLNPHAKWSNGTAITEADYAANLMACNGKHRRFECASDTGYKQIKSVSEGGGGRDSVVVKLKPAFSDWKALFTTYLYPRRYYKSGRAFNSGYRNKIPVTAGPFGNPKLDRSKGTVTVTRDPNWWGRTPRLSKIVFKALSTSAANRGFVHGRVDYDFGVAVDKADYRTISLAKHGHVTLAAGPDYRQLTINSVHDRHHFMKSGKVRRAVELAINRNALIKSDLAGIPWPTVPLDNHFFMNVQKRYRDNMGGLASYNPQQADRLLHDSGFRKDSHGYYAKRGHEINLDFMIPAGIRSSRHESKLTKAMLEKAGIKMHVTKVSPSKWAGKYLIPGRFDIAPFSWLGTPFPISSSVSIYSSPRHGGGQNFTGTSNRAVDRLLRRALSASSATKAATLANRADRLLYREVHTITLFERPQMCGVSDGLANIGSFGFASIDYTKIGWMKKS
jgi:peptide/nickel transport system substrate-binding protein